MVLDSVLGEDDSEAVVLLVSAVLSVEPTLLSLELELVLDVEPDVVLLSLEVASSSLGASDSKIESEPPALELEEEEEGEDSGEAELELLWGGS